MRLNMKAPAIFEAVVLLLCGVVIAQDDAAELTEEELAQFEETVFVPSPGDLFLALDRLGTVNWDAAVDYNTEFDYDNAYSRALNLGVKGADGFIAIQAEDRDKLLEMISAIIKIAEELGVSETILIKSGRFQQLAENNEWRELRMELDVLRDDVEYDLIQQGDDDIALLLLAGGWVEGLHITSKALSENYTEEGSMILYQPDLVAYFDEQFSELGSGAQDQEAVQKIEGAIPEIMDLIDVGYQNPVPKENIEKLHEISAELIEAIEKG